MVGPAGRYPVPVCFCSLSQTTNSPSPCSRAAAQRGSETHENIFVIRASVRKSAPSETLALKPVENQSKTVGNQRKPSRSIEAQGTWADLGKSCYKKPCRRKPISYMFWPQNPPSRSYLFCSMGSRAPRTPSDTSVPQAAAPRRGGRRSRPT